MNKQFYLYEKRIDNHNSEFSWVVASSQAEAKKIYDNEVGDISDPNTFIKKTGKELDNLYIWDTNECEPEEGLFKEEDYVNGYKVIDTMASYIPKNQYAHFIPIDNN